MWYKPEVTVTFRSAANDIFTRALASAPEIFTTSGTPDI